MKRINEVCCAFFLFFSSVVKRDQRIYSVFELHVCQSGRVENSYHIFPVLRVPESTTIFDLLKFRKKSGILLQFYLQILLIMLILSNIIDTFIDWLHKTNRNKKPISRLYSTKKQPKWNLSGWNSLRFPFQRMIKRISDWCSGALPAQVLGCAFITPK